MNKVGRILTISTAVLLAGISAASVTFTANNTDIVKDFFTGKQSYSNSQYENLKADVSSLTSANTEKDNTISGMEIQIEDLQKELAGPQSFQIPEDIKLTKVVLLKTTEKYALVSSTESTEEGLWAVDKETGEFNQLLDYGYNYASMIDCGSSEYLVSSFGDNTGLTLINLSDLTTKQLYNKSYGWTRYYNFSKDKSSIYLYTQNGSAGNTGFIHYVFSTKEATHYENNAQTYIIIDVDLDNVLYCNNANMFVYNLTEKTSSQVEITFGRSNVYKYVYSINDGIYMNTANGFYEFNKLTKTADLISSDITIYFSGNSLLNEDTTVFYGSTTYIFKPSTKSLIAVSRNTSEARLLKNGNILLKVGFMYYEYTDEGTEVTSFSVNSNTTCLALPNGDFVFGSNVYAYDEETNAYALETYTNQGITYTNYEEVEDGYLLKDDSGLKTVLYNPTAKTMTIYSIVLE